MPYAGNSLAVGGFTFFGGNDFGGSGKPKYGGIFSAVKQYKGNFLVVSGFSFFGGNVNVNSKHGGKCGALLPICICFWRPNKRQTFSRWLPLYIPYERLVCTAISSIRSKTNRQICGFLLHHEWNPAASCKTYEQRMGKKAVP